MTILQKLELLKTVPADNILSDALIREIIGEIDSNTSRLNKKVRNNTVRLAKEIGRLHYKKQSFKGVKI